MKSALAGATGSLVGSLGGSTAVGLKLLGSTAAGIAQAVVHGKDARRERRSRWCRVLNVGLAGQRRRNWKPWRSCRIIWLLRRERLLGDLITTGVGERREDETLGFVVRVYAALLANDVNLSTPRWLQRCCHFVC